MHGWHGSASGRAERENMIKNRLTRIAMLGLGAGLWLGSVQAQNATRDNPEGTGVSPGTEGTNVGEAGRVIVTGVSPDQSILPTVRPISSVYGTDMNIVDVPRDVSTITKEQVSFRQITSVDDLGQFASGTYTASIFGSEGLPQIRGLPAEIYLNGQREHYYLNSFPPSFNGVESIDIVKGPGTAVYGPASQGLGGYVNLVTKQPFFDGQHTEITSIIGDFYGSPDNYGRYQWELDNSGPLIKDKLAYRVSYLGRESSGYYRNIYDNVEDIFAALTYLPTSNLKFDLNGHYEESKFNENAGFNRVTQDLIDNHTYIKGPILPGYAPFEGVIDPGPDGSYDDQKVKLHNDQVLVAPGDSAAGSRFTGQLISTLTLPGVTIKNSTIGDTVESRKFSDYGYDEYAPVNIAIENRTEVQFDLNTPITSGRDVIEKKDGKDAKDKDGGTTHIDGLVFKNHFDVGVSFRYEYSRDYAALINEPFSVYDISGKGPTPVKFPNSLIFGPERTIPGMPGYYNSDLFGSGAVTEYYQGGIFAQDNVDFTSWLSGIVGARIDFIDAQSGRPAEGPLVDPTMDFGGPGDPTQPIAEARRNDTLIANGSYFGSLIYKPIKQGSLYFTYDRVDGTGSANNQGSLPYVYEADGSTRVTAGTLRQVSALIEGGAKVSLLHDTMFLGVAGYHQSRYQTDQRGNVSQVSAHGVDVDFTYQPNKNFSVTSNFTWQAANYIASTSYSQTGNYLDMFAAGVNVDGNVGTGVGSPNYASYPKGNYRLPDTPNILYNAYFIAQTDWGLGFGIGPQVTGDVNVNLQGTLVIPAQVTLNGFIFYKQKNYEVRLSFFNITDERNWTPPATFSNNDLIYPDEPFHMNATFKVRF